MENQLQKALSSGQFVRLDSSYPYRDCYLHREKGKTRESKYGLRVKGMFSGRQALLYLCENCINDTIWEDVVSGNIRFSPDRAKCN